MAIFKCKMCGGTLEIGSNQMTAVCEYCGTQQTLPKLDDDRRANLYDRANHFRRNNEYDKAMGIYEQILNEDTTDAEAYWSLVLCRYGIEYVEDPSTHKRVPTVNRAQFGAVSADEDYKSAVANADAGQKAIYESEAQAIDEIQKGILAISQKEEPFDVFICYKETDANGRRTPDSVLATELYHELTKEGFNVFFSRITLEDKLGAAYEPYIFAALNSAKVMVALGTKSEYFNAVWVKNEWSRYLTLVKQSGSKKVLIPAFKDMDPYDLPEEFSHLQAQDMSKLGFMQDLVRGIKKLAASDEPKATVKETVVVNNAPASTANIASLLERAFMFLEDGDWQSANEYCEKVLDLEPKNVRAYLGKLMAELQCHKQDDLKDCAMPFDDSSNYAKAVRFGDEKLKNELQGCINFINGRNETARLTGLYNTALQKMNTAETEIDYEAAAELFNQISNFKDSAAKAEECIKKSETALLTGQYNDALQNMNTAVTESDYKAAAELFRQISDFKDSDAKAEECTKKAEKARIAANEAAEKAKKKAKKIASNAIPVIAVVIVFIIVLNTIIFPTIYYNKGVKLLESEDYEAAIESFYKVVDFKDANEKLKEALMSIGSYASLSAGFFNTVGIKADGTVVAVGGNEDGQCDVGDWSDIVAVSAGFSHTVGLKADGTVVAVGGNEDGQCDVGDWSNIIAISAGKYHTVGLKADGTVVAVGGNEDGQCDVGGWSNIIAVSAGNSHTVGLKADGTVVAVGSNAVCQCDVGDWSDIVAVSAGCFHTVGLKADGTVVAVGSNAVCQCDVGDWSDIIAVSTRCYHTVGIMADGTVVAVGSNGDGRCNVGDWSDIELPEK